ncbi:tyrosine--tRNA ligase [Demetria terragena]|uniref:tyrosine--tRNA ligase n=1 Tax=Demetria terragena TaxID=63959 RepID=UPI00035F731E|nr:tyrosine--tRNA ligase [Demetria terragena]
MSKVFDELQWRGLVAQSTDEAALREAIDGGQVTVYCGFDPTAASLHIGHLVQLIVLRHLQRAGHRVICLVGGSTGQIGDPRPTSERVLHTKEQTAEWVASIQEQVRPFLDLEGDNPAVMVNNLDWTAPMSALDFLRDVGKHFRVNSMIKRDIVARRLESDQGISYTEFSYQLLQGLDYLHLYRTYDCTLQVGGSDQWGNLLSGVDLVHSAEGARVHAQTTPLITDAEGRKLGKSEGNALWLNGDLMSPYAFYQYWLNTEDAVVIDRMKVFTDLSAADIGEYEHQVADEPFRRAAQRRLATDVTTLVHGAEATAAVEAASAALFGKGDVGVLDERTLLDATAELPGGPADAGDTIVDVLIKTGVADSRNAARRLLSDGGISLNNAKLADPDYALEEGDFLHGRVALIKRGRKHQVAARRG